MCIPGLFLPSLCPLNPLYTSPPHTSTLAYHCPPVLFSLFSLGILIPTHLDHPEHADKPYPPGTTQPHSTCSVLMATCLFVDSKLSQFVFLPLFSESIGWVSSLTPNSYFPTHQLASGGRPLITSPPSDKFLAAHSPHYSTHLLPPSLSFHLPALPHFTRFSFFHISLVALYSTPFSR